MTGHNHKPGIILQERDNHLFRGLFESRIMTRQHLAELYFDGKVEACKKRVQKLLATKMIAEQNRRPNEPAVLFLARLGFDTLADAGMLTDYPQRAWRSFQKRVSVSEATIRHELEVMNVKAAFTTAIRDRPDLSLAEFSTWPKLYEFRALRPVTRDGWTHDREVLMKPDGFIRIHEQDRDGVAEHCFFLEVDQGTETLATIASKALGYRDYYRRGGFAKRMKCDPTNPAACPFRVLIILGPAERRNNVAQQLLHQTPPITRQVWLTTMENIVDNPLGAIWSRPDDHDHVTARKAFGSLQRDGADFDRQNKPYEAAAGRSTRQLLRD